MHVSHGISDAFSTGVPAPVAAPAELGVGPQRSEHDADPQEQPGGEGEAADRFDPVGVHAARQQRSHPERERDRAERVARVEHRRVDHHRREAQQRIEPRAFRRRGMGGREGIGVEHHQRHEEGAEAEHDRGRVGRDVAQALARQEQREARPQRHQPRPQQQRAFLRRPDRGGSVEGRRGAAGGVGDRVEGEVVAQERELEHEEGDRQHAGERVDRAASEHDQLGPPVAHAVQRDAGAVGAHGDREQQAGEAEAGHQSAPACAGRSPSASGRPWTESADARGRYRAHAVPLTRSGSRSAERSCTWTGTW